MNKIYIKLWFVILIGIFIPPYAIFATWKFMEYEKRTKIFLTVAWSFWFIIMIGAAGGNNNDDNVEVKEETIYNFSITDKYVNEGTEDEYYDEIDMEFNYESYYRQEGLQLICGEDFDLDRTINYSYADTNDTTLMHFTSVTDPNWEDGEAWPKTGSFQCQEGQMLDIYGDDGTIKFTAPKELKTKGTESSEIEDTITTTSENINEISCMKNDNKVNCDDIKSYPEMEKELKKYIDISLKDNSCDNTTVSEYELTCK